MMEKWLFTVLEKKDIFTFLLFSFMIPVLWDWWNVQADLSKLQAQEQFPSVIVEHVDRKVQTWKDAISWQVSLALEMMKAWEIPVIKLPELAWPVPTDYLKNVKEWFWEDVAKKYEKFASYFTDYVKEKKQEKIAEYLLAVFNNPWKESTFNRFLKKLKRYSNWKEVSQEKINELEELTDNMWIVLNQDIKKLASIGVSKEEQIRKLKSDIARYKELKEQLNKKLKTLTDRSKTLTDRSKTLGKEINDIKKEIQILEKTIEEREQDIAKLKGTVNNSVSI